MNVCTVRDQSRHCYIGIIDVLTPYRIKKRAETFLLGTIVCGRDISCQHPKVYAKRFFRFVDKQVFDTGQRRPSRRPSRQPYQSTSATLPTSMKAAASFS